MKNIHFNLAITIMVINYLFVGMLRKIFFDTLLGGYRSRKEWRF